MVERRDIVGHFSQLIEADGRRLMGVVQDEEIGSYYQLQEINNKGFPSVAERNTDRAKDVRLGADFRGGGAVHTANSGAADSDIEADMKNNKEQDEEQSIENCMHENGGRTGLHVHKINGVMLPWDLQQQTR
ncbi:hypothetical protein V6N13_053071 [Hibiscus sabdariffa]